MKSFSREECIDTVLQSPAAVAAGDRQAWLNIFCRYNIVEDPLGSPAHVSGLFDRRQGQRGNGPLLRFYQTFIAPYEIRFHVDRDVVEGLTVVRDLTIEIRMSPLVTVHVPMHLVYELRQERGELKIFRLAAHWEVMASLKQQMSYGWASVVVGCRAGLRMFRHLGVSGMLGFMRAIHSVGEPGKNRVDTFVRFVNGANEDGLGSLMDGEGATITCCAEVLSTAQLAAAGFSLSTGKILSAGNMVSASCRLVSPVSDLQGVVFFEFNMNNQKIIDVRFFLED